MARDVQLRRGVIERIPEPEELDQKHLPRLTLDLAQEIKEEIDAIWELLGEKERAALPWAADKDLSAHEAVKERLKAILKNHGK